MKITDNLEARYYIKKEHNKVKCNLCPHNCIITDGNSGICKVRINKGGKLFFKGYEKLSAINFDPIEKKPLYHFHPGTEILSIGTFGCNFRCKCCQNYEISQTSGDDFPRVVEMSVKELIKTCNKSPINIGVAYTYNEPSVWFEYMFDAAREVKKAGFKNVVVTNGYINLSPLEELLEYMDAFNVDLKVFNEIEHKRFTGGLLSNVLDTIKTIGESDKHLELTHLVIPGLNDDLDEFRHMMEWILEHLGIDTPLHLSRYFPKYRMSSDATSHTTLHKMAEIAKSYIHHVYMGNLPGNEFQDTFCPDCDSIVIRRKSYLVNFENMTDNGSCRSCGKDIVVM